MMRVASPAMNSWGTVIAKAAENFSKESNLGLANPSVMR